MYLDAISKPTNIRNLCALSYITHTVYMLHVSAIHMAIFRDVHFIACIEILLKFLNQRIDVKYSILKILHYLKYIGYCGPGSSVGIVTGYGMDGPGIESR